MSFELIMVLFRDGGHSIDEALRPSHYASGSKLKQWLRVTRIRGDMNVIHQLDPRADIAE